MATLEKGFLPMTGSVGNVSVYKRRDLDQLIVRAKSGPRKESVLKADSYARTRELNQEWSGCALAGKNIRIAIHPLTHMADYNISGPLNAIMKVIQKRDTVNKHGERDIDISKHRMLLDGFSLNKQNYWESVVKSPLSYGADRQTGQAFVEIPELIPGVNFANKYKRGLVRFTGVLGIISDVKYSEGHHRYEPAGTQVSGGNFITISTSWQPATIPVAKLRLEMEIRSAGSLQETDTLLLAVGMEFGNPVTDNLVEPIKYSGSAKILTTA